MQQHHITLESCIPSSPYTERGMASFLDIQGSIMLYFNGPTIVLKSIDNFNNVKTYQHKSDIKAAKLSYDGKFVASIDQKGTLIIHQIGIKQLFQFKKYQNFFLGAKHIDFSSDRKKICVVGASTKTFGRVASIQTGTNVGEITGVSANLSVCAFKSLKSNKLVVGGDQFNIKLYQGPPYKFVKSVKSHANYINDIKYSPDGSFIVSVSSDKKIVLYNGQNIEITKQKINAHQGGIFGVDWIDQKHFVTVSADKTIKIWDIQLEQKKVIYACSQQNLKNMKKIQFFQVAVKYFNNKIYSLSLNGNVTVYNNPMTQIVSQQTKCLVSIKSKPKKIINVDDRNLVIFDNSGKILRINSEDLSVCQIYQSVSGKGIMDGFWNKQSSTLTVLWSDTEISQFKWSISDNALSQNFTIKQSNTKFICHSQHFQLFGASNSHIYAFQKQQEAIKSVLQEDPNLLTEYHNQKFSMVLVATVKGNILMYNANSLELVSKAKISSNKITSLHFISSNLTSFLCGDSLGCLKVWKINNQRKLQQIFGNIGNHNTLVTSIKSIENKIYTAGMDNKIYIWKFDESGTQLQRIYQQSNVHHFGVLDLQIINSQRIATCGGDLLIKFWKV